MRLKQQQNCWVLANTQAVASDPVVAVSRHWFGCDSFRNRSLRRSANIMQFHKAGCRVSCKEENERGQRGQSTTGWWAEGGSRFSLSPLTAFCTLSLSYQPLFMSKPILLKTPAFCLI